MVWREGVAKAALSTALSLWFGLAVAQAAPVQIPDTFLSGIAPASSAGIERPAALKGSTYTVIAPTYTGGDGNISFLRLYNGNDGNTTFTLTIVGTPSARVYGTATYSVPSQASPQYSMSEILTRANAGALTGSDTGYAIYMRAPSVTAVNGFQHVIYNNANGFFENVSACTYSPDVNYADFNQMLINVHTTALASYPTQVTIHNYQNVSVEYDATVIDARNGEAIGNVLLRLDANASYTVPFSWFEVQLGFKPTANQAHVNLKFNAVEDQGGPSAVVSQAIYNQPLAAYVGMTLFCSVNP